MRTAIVSDLHIGAMTGTDLGRDAELGALLVDELSGADRVVLLGDTLELRDRPAGEIVELATPFLQRLGGALGDGEIVLVPGNHDHRLAEALLEGHSLGEPSELGLEQRFEPSSDLARQIAERLAPARVGLAYPGLGLRDDVWAMHGHYMDCHMRIPTIECLSAAATMRLIGPIPRSATPADYERAIAPIYGFSWGFAQARGPERIGGRARPTAAAWRRLSGDGNGRVSARLLGAVAFPLAARGIGRALGRRFDTDISVANISRAGLAAMQEALERLGVRSAHVVYGHTHRPGPLTGDQPQDWRLASGSCLHATGSWTYTRGLCGPRPQGSIFWPGTVTWVEDDGPPRRRELLHELSHEDLRAAVQRIRGTDPART